jgi:multicomponent Na+:H+ antiporter subunit D
MTSPLPALPVAFPLLGAGLLAALRKWLSRAAADSLGIVVAAATLVSSLLLLSHALQHTQVYWFGNWYPRGSAVLGITFVVDPVAAGLSSLSGLLVLLALIFSWRFVDAAGNHYHPLMLVFLAAMDGFVLTGDLFNMFVFFELMSTAAFAYAA